MKYIEEPWVIIQSYFEGKYRERLVRHQLESYNNFVNEQMMNTIRMFNPVHIFSSHPDDYDETTQTYKLELMLSFDNFKILRPTIYENNGATKTMFPNEARMRNFTYWSTIMIDVCIQIIHTDNEGNKEIKHKTIPNVHIGKIPIMLKSVLCELTHHKHIPLEQLGECPYDTGGYFIINGSEKVVVSQERASENKVYVFKQKKSSRWSWNAEIKSIPDTKIISPKQIEVLVSTKDNGMGFPIYVQLPRLKNPVPLWILFRSLGIITDKSICQIIIGCEEPETNVDKQLLNFLKASIIQSSDVMTQEEAFIKIVHESKFYPMNMTEQEGHQKKKDFTAMILEKDLFPHCKSQREKILFLGYMTKQLLLTILGYRSQDDRDRYNNKKIDLTGTVLNNLFRNYFNKVVKDMIKQIQKEIKTGTSWRASMNYLNIITKSNIYKMIKPSTIENGFKRALATGDFGVNTVGSSKVGVAQVLKRLTYIDTLSHLRRVNTPIDKSGKLIPPRKLHPTSWGFICPSETPEGGSIGVVKNLSILANVTIPSQTEYLYVLIKDYVKDINECTMKDIQNGIKVMINGCWVGMRLYDGYKFFKELKQMKYTGRIHIYTSISFNIYSKEIRICNESGRIIRPVLRVENGKLLITSDIIQKLKDKKLSWNEMCIQYHVIEFIDADEQNTSLIAMSPKDLTPKNPKYKYYNYCEIHPSVILGLIASCIPFPEHNQSPRVTYQSAQAKQAMGIYATNFDKRMDKTSYILTYPMKPIVDTRIMNIMKLQNIPAGEMAIVAIATYTGYNQEDSLIFNKASIDRGLFSATVYHTEKDETRKVFGDEELRCKPQKHITKGLKFANYDKLTSKGFIPEQKLVEDRDIIIGKVIPIKENRNDLYKVMKYQDLSIIYRTNEETFIDKNYQNRNGDGYNFSKVRLRTLRKPVIGDKFSSRSSQKGTIGMILPEVDMPFTSSGIRPDLIMNPHAIPSRMTIGQLKESLMGQVLVELGLFGDATSFTQVSLDIIRGEMLKCGYEYHGNHIMYNGYDGNMMEVSIFMGPTYYQRLKHMVLDKVHSRSQGPMVILTRQPGEGRTRDGGLRFGEMERDCMISHGAAKFTQERLYISSDKYAVHVCKECGLMVPYNKEKHIHECSVCENTTDFSYVKIPYSCKLLFQELLTMNVAPRILTSN